MNGESELLSVRESAILSKDNTLNGVDTNIHSVEPTTKKYLTKILVLLFACAAILALVHYFPITKYSFDLTALKNNFQQKPFRGVLLFIPLTLIMNALGTPRLWICIAAGSLYGALAGFFLAMTVTLSGACLNYWTGRAFGSIDFLRVPTKFEGLVEKSRNEGFWVLVYARLFPLSNATLINVLSGLANIPFKDFFYGTLVGFIPSTMVFTLMGCSVEKNNKLYYAISGGVFLGFVLWRRWIKSRFVRVNKQ